MSLRRTIMDAGPGLNFFSINKERLLFSVLGALSVPEIVEEEILRKSRRDERFAAAERVWKRLPPRLMHVLSDDVTGNLPRRFTESRECRSNSASVLRGIWGRPW